MGMRHLGEKKFSEGDVKIHFCMWRGDQKKKKWEGQSSSSP